ncbi:hypothetical protein [Ramlibacter sp. AN1133]|uniref:hypothetical protein n=1 Tax=Ramlibacter sp. AN1133 TaxID=3133429 RepID=UPI0030C1BE1C
MTAAPDDFTEASYRELLRLTAAQYAICGYREPAAGPHAILRHDLDASLQRALALARIESEEGVQATYFVFPRCLYYNLLHPDSKRVVDEILSLGHRLALHFDVSMDHAPEDLQRLVQFEKALIEHEFGRPAEAVSFHLAGDFRSRLPQEDEVCGMVNAYSARMAGEYRYVSDSNGVWRFEPWLRLIDAVRHPRLHILTHPEWWTPGPLTPRQRLQRAIDGYARRMGAWYDETTRKSNRPNY